MGLYERLRSRLSRTRETLSDGITAIFQGGRVIDQALLDELEELLYAADLGPVAARIVQEVGRLHRRGDVNGEAEVRSVLRETLLELVAPSGLATGEIELAARPHVVLVVGVNGSGKTTTIAKLANRFQQQGKSVLLAACDTFRAAAAEQLEIWAERNAAPLVRGAEGADPASVAYDAVESAEVLGIDVVLVDTAGRLHTQKNLMQELSKVQRVIAKRLTGAPHDVWLVLDGTNGQNAIQQAREFLAAVGVSGLVITKLDGTARGGAVFSIVHMLGLPVRYIGTGETLEDIEPFEPQAFVDAVLSDVRAGARPGG
ncbi:MAG TPA: signal recognition particle-docking protein FtsY [Planctomycetota bacterium]|nr:signal recognition particle-docking protein FtsY [Planctomycetota bacterium]